MSDSYGATASSSNHRILGGSESPIETSTTKSQVIPNTQQAEDNDDDDDDDSIDSAMIDNINNERRPLLSPDDPRVTPMNLKNVKLLRFFLHTLLIINIIWLVLSLISYFVLIPGFDSHGKSYFEFSFIFISLYLNFLSYAFFLVPSDLQVDNVLNYTCLGLILFDFFIILVFPYQRTQYAWTEYITLLFAIFSIGLNMVSNTYVLKAKKHEEIRLTGRVETRKTFNEHFQLTVEFLLKLVLILYVIAISLNIFIKSVDSAVAKPWGELVADDNDEYRVHIYCQGDVYNVEKNDQPVVLLESGFDSSEEFVMWVQELYQLNKVHKYCIYDRPGYGFSDSSPSPYSLGINSDLLSSVLRKKNITGPYLLVGHGIGGLYSRTFASRHINDIHSVLLVDSWTEELLLSNPFRHAKNKDNVLPREIPKLNRRYGFKLWLEGVFSSANLRSYYDLFIHRFRSSDRIFGDDMNIQGKYLRARLQEQVSASILSYNDIQLAKNALNDADKQVSVISSRYLIKQSLNWGNWQRDLTKISHNAHNEWVLTDAGHKIWENPEGKRKLQKLLLRMLGEVDDI